MSHHMRDISEAQAKVLHDLFGSPEGLGATGEFPDGRVTDDDEGEIRFAVAADSERGLVHIDFGKPVHWMAMTPEQATEVGMLIRAKALEIKLHQSESD